MLKIDGAYLETDSDSESSSADESDTNRQPEPDAEPDAESLNSADDVSDSNDNEIFDTGSAQ